MNTGNTLIWQKILWSVVINFGVTLLAYIKYKNSSNIIGFDIYPYVLSPYVGATSIIIILLRIWDILATNSFLLVFTATVNVYIGSLGVYLNATSDVQIGFLMHVMFYVNILIATYIFFDIFRKKIHL